MIGFCVEVIAVILGASFMTYYETKLIKSVFVDKFDYFDRMHKITAIVSTLFVILGGFLAMKGI